MRGERDRKTSKMLAVRAEKRSFLLPMVVCSTPCWCADHAHHRCYFLFSLLCLSACSRGRFGTCPRSRSCASAAPSRRIPYTAGRPILPRARRQRGAFQTQPIHCGPEARAPRCEREGWLPNLISPTTFLFHGGRRMKHHSGQVSLRPIPVADHPPFPPACGGEGVDEGANALCERGHCER